ncbi:TlpA disulfide reductase family protein [sulfur-oxidizing endosymbiont of Gigantopelta aegis]|uniref:TlpA disulfide reductase family protein n=1 Tax=sulfur-oxidizing endosymbiont of Gigantopelta aegis TaxID=2794934 RepID=UPI0018DC9D66|nr:TlpA disulfide reductase family protein [sulfur-oxidizing endosymbiont of Gigantopelta aegis]
MKKHLLLLVLLTLTISTHAERQQPELSHELTKVSKVIAASDFELQNMDEENIKFSDYRGKVVLLNFWATWCPPCVREIPSMERLQQKFAKDNFKVIALNQTEDPDKVFAFTGQLELDPTFEIIFDRESTVAQAYAVRGLPTTYLVDKKGNIRYRAVGGREFDHPEVLKIIRQLIAE